MSKADTNGFKSNNTCSHKGLGHVIFQSSDLLISLVVGLIGIFQKRNNQFSFQIKSLLLPKRNTKHPQKASK